MVGHYTSSLGRDVTDMMEPLLSTPHDLGYQKSGMFFGASLVAQSTRWSTTSSIFRSTLDHYMKRCVLDGTNIGISDIDELTTSGSLIGTLVSEAPNALAFYNEFTNSTVTCSDGIADLMNELDDYIDKVLINKSNQLFGDNLYESSLQKVDRLTGSMDGMLGLVTSSAATSRDMLAQSILIQALDDAAMGYIADAGNAAAMQHYQTARADRQTVASYKAAFTQATKWVPMLKIAFEFVYYCFFPIAVFLMLSPMAFTIVKSYASGFIWLASWEPISAILHALVIRRSTGYYREAGMMTQDDGSVAFTMSFANHLGIRSVEYDVSVLAGSMMAMVPFLAFSIMYGARQIASASTAMTNVAQSAAIETGKETATGNHSLSNVSMNNTNANKLNTSAMVDQGRSTEVLGSGATRTVNADGVTTYNTGTAGSSFLMGANMTQSLRNSASASVQTAQSSVTSARSEETQAYERQHGVTSEILERSSMSGTMTDSGGHSFSEAQQSSVSNTRNKVDTLGRRHNLNSDLALSAAMGVPLKVADARMSMTSSTRDDYSRALDASETSGLTKEMSSVEQFRRESGWQSSEEHGMGENYSTRDLSSESNRASMTRSVAEDRLERAEETQSRTSSSDAQVNASYGNMLQHYARNKMGMSESEMLRVLNPQTPEAQRDAARLTDGFVSAMANGQLGGGFSTSAPKSGDLGAVALSPNGGRAQGNYNQSRAGLASNPVSNPVIGNAAITDRQTDQTLDANKMGNTRIRHAEGTGQDIDSRQRTNEDWVDNNDMVRQFGTEVKETFKSVGNAVVGGATYLLGGDGDSGGGGGAGNDVLGTGVVRPDKGAAPAGNTDQHSGIRPRSNPNSGNNKTGTEFVKRGFEEWQASGGALRQGAPNSIGGSGAGGGYGGGGYSGGALVGTDRDMVIRTVIGEAAQEGARGWEAVANVIQNRMEDPRWSGNASDVVLQEKQFSAWNSGAGGNSLVNKYNQGDDMYERVGKVVDQVFSGEYPKLCV